MLICICVFLKYLGDYEKLIFKWPSIFSLVFLLGRFVYILVKGVRIHLGQRQAVSVCPSPTVEIMYLLLEAPGCKMSQEAHLTACSIFRSLSEGLFSK